MNLTQLTDEVLLSETKRVVRLESEATLTVLYHLLEVDRRKLFSDLRCSSLFVYATDHLGYEPSEAYRRIAAMRMLKEVPELAKDLASGALGLTHLNLAHSFIKDEEKSQERKFTRVEKQELLESMRHKSTRAAEKILKEKSTRPKAKTVKIEVDVELIEKLKALKDHLAHSSPNATDSEILHQAVDLMLEQFSAPKKSPRVTAEVRRQVWKRDGGKCTGCGSRHALEYDHYPIPWAMGGPSTVENLRLRCRNCNQREGVKFFGAEKMRPQVSASEGCGEKAAV